MADPIVAHVSVRGKLALSYAERGWYVLPLHTVLDDGSCSCEKPLCENVGKHPRTAHGLKDATTNERQILAWWSRWPDANIGVRTGPESGIFVLDMDPRHKGDLSRDRLEATFGRIPRTLRSATGGLGIHYVFRHPGFKIKNDSNTIPGYDGLDTRGDGGYIVAPGSNHRSGIDYAWVYVDDEVAEAPEWLLTLLKPTAKKSTSAPRPVQSIDGSTEARFWLERYLGVAGEGNRNETGKRLALQLRDSARLTIEEAEPLMVEYAERVPGQDYTEREALATLRSIYSRPAREPARSIDPKPALRLVEKREEYHKNDHSEEPPEELDPATGEHKTDMGNARRLVRRHGKNLRYVVAWAEWLIWDGQRWRRDDSGEIFRRAKETAQSIFAEAAETDELEEQKAIVKWAFQSESRQRIESMVKLAQSEPEVAIRAQAFDSYPWLLNVQNGTIDLKTGELRAHRREDLITKLAPVVYDPDARLEMWERFLQTVTGGNAVLIDFLQRAAGYTLTGDTSEEKLFFPHGPTRAGKSTFAEALKATLGEYAMTADFESFVARQSSGGPRDDIADLAGARMVASIEVDEGKKLAEGLVKMLTGGDTVKARHLYQKGFEFQPAFKLWLIANHEPRVDAADDAMWARILRIKFDQQIPKEKRDPKVKKTLRDPAKGGPAILAWAVQGCLAWQRDGLGIPDEVEQATDEYREAMDPLRDFIADCCEMESNAWVSVALLRKTYDDWCKANGERYPLSGRKFNEVLERKHCVQKPRRVNSKQTRGWEGINVVAEL